MLTGSTEGAQLWDIQSRRRVGPVYRYSDDVMDVALTRDGKMAALAQWNGYGVLWSLPALPESVKDDPKRITWWVQASVGMKLDEGGGRQVLNAREWLDIQK